MVIICGGHIQLLLDQQPWRVEDVKHPHADDPDKLTVHAEWPALLDLATPTPHP